jgi:hypothetical protein
MQRSRCRHPALTDVAEVTLGPPGHLLLGTAERLPDRPALPQGLLQPAHSQHPSRLRETDVDTHQMGNLKTRMFLGMIALVRGTSATFFTVSRRIS